MLLNITHIEKKHQLSNKNTVRASYPQFEVRFVEVKAGNMHKTLKVGSNYR